MNDVLKNNYEKLKVDIINYYEKLKSESMWLCLATIGCVSIPYWGFKISAFIIIQLLFVSKLDRSTKSFPKRLKELKIECESKEDYDLIKNEINKSYNNSWPLIVCCSFSGIIFLYEAIIVLV